MMAGGHLLLMNSGECLLENITLIISMVGGYQEEIHHLVVHCLSGKVTLDHLLKDHPQMLGSPLLLPIIYQLVLQIQVMVFFHVDQTCLPLIVGGQLETGEIVSLVGCKTNYMEGGSLFGQNNTTT